MLKDRFILLEDGRIIDIEKPAGNKSENDYYMLTLAPGHTTLYLGEVGTENEVGQVVATAEELIRLVNMSLFGVNKNVKMYK